MRVKGWMPRFLRPVVAAGLRLAEPAAESRHRLNLSECAYQSRFRRPHPVVPNAVCSLATSSPASRPGLSYLGSVTMARGCDAMVVVARELRRQTDGAVSLEVIGSAADSPREAALRAASLARDHHTVARAVRLVRTAQAGLVVGWARPRGGRGRCPPTTRRCSAAPTAGDQRLTW